MTTTTIFIFLIFILLQLDWPASLGGPAVYLSLITQKQNK